ncbi:MAG: hypothetical protein DRJ18_00670 [Candidatus Methanomethylicota archaeon]|nr:MAG: hypothetical protein DRJ18_00670 [Candidatus Verstraetearchaeota archaeon]
MGLPSDVQYFDSYFTWLMVNEPWRHTYEDTISAGATKEWLIYEVPDGHKLKLLAIAVSFDQDGIFPTYLIAEAPDGSKYGFYAEFIKQNTKLAVPMAGIYDVPSGYKLRVRSSNPLSSDVRIAWCLIGILYKPSA